jgi:hypothetical protein
MGSADRIGTMYTETYLRGVASVLFKNLQDESLTGYNDENPDDHFVWVSAGSGEIHLSNEGCWWLHWAPDHGLDGEEELTEPVTDDPGVMAWWMLEQIPLFEER